MISFNSIFYGNNQKFNIAQNMIHDKVAQPKNDSFVKRACDTNHDGKTINTISFKGNSDNTIKEIAKDAKAWGKLIKIHYDEKYGKGNWEYVCIGRSCACFADSLERMGVPVHIIPISNLTHSITHGSELTQKPGFDDFKQFIYEQGLNPKNIQASRKKYIFQDYCDSGASLKKFEEFIRCNEMGLDLENIVFENLTQVFQINIQKMSRDEMERVINSYPNLQNQNTPLSFKNYTSVPKMDCNDLTQISKIKDYPNTALHSSFIKELDEIIKEDAI